MSVDLDYELTEQSIEHVGLLLINDCHLSRVISNTNNYMYMYALCSDKK